MNDLDNAHGNWRWFLPRALLWVAAALWIALVRMADAQDAAWLQIEALPNQTAAEERARAYAQEFDNVGGFRVGSRWWAITLGPYAPDVARAELLRLRRARAIPSDSFLVDGGGFGEQFWPSGAAGIIQTPLSPQSGDTAEAAEPPIPAEETPAEARRAERSLTRAEREEIQRALQTLGFYTSRIDAAFGPGTRRAMAAWQTAFGYEPTGIMTTAQRRELVDGLRAARDSLGLELVTDREAGIEITLPLGEVAFQSYEAPFARYDGDTAQVLLISQSGDQNTLRGLYDVMQTLEIVPLDGPRDFGRNSFTLTGSNDRIISYTFARLSDGTVKGFTLVWPQGDELRRKLALDRMQDSFVPIPGAVLPDTAGDTALQRPDLLAGFQVRQPDAAASGFYVDAGGAVLTLADTVAACGRITIGPNTEAEVAATDPALGLALLRPRRDLAPLGVGRLSASPPRLQSDIAVAGFSYSGVLGAPTVSFGTLEDLRGLAGEENLKRLALNALPGDAGGPVLDAGGAVLGMLLPRKDSDRTLPAEVQFAVDSTALAAFLGENGIGLTSGGAATALSPEEIALIGADMTVLVECWN